MKESIYFFYLWEYDMSELYNPNFYRWFQWAINLVMKSWKDM